MNGQRKSGVRIDTDSIGSISNGASRFTRFFFLIDVFFATKTNPNHKTELEQNKLVSTPKDPSKKEGETESKTIKMEPPTKQTTLNAYQSINQSIRERERNVSKQRTTKKYFFSFGP